MLTTMKRTVLGSLRDLHEEYAKKAAMPMFKQLAMHFVSLHDSPGVMLHKKTIQDAVSRILSTLSSRD